MSDLCSLYPTIFTMTCVSLNKTMQIQTGLTYQCVGNTSSNGFVQNKNGAFVGKN